MANERNYIIFVISNFVSLLVVGLIQIVFAANTYAFSKNVDVGAFYVGTFCIILCFTSLGFQVEQGRVLYLMGTGLCIIASLVGSIIDLRAADALYSLVVCGNTEGVVWGDPDHFDDMGTFCHIDERTASDTCYCVSITEANTDDESDIYKCKRFIQQDGFTAGDCSPVLDEYATLASTSGSLCFLLMIVCVVFSCVGCSTMCCHCCHFDKHDPASVLPLPQSFSGQQAAPTEIVAMMISNAATSIQQPMHGATRSFIYSPAQDVSTRYILPISAQQQQQQQQQRPFYSYNLDEDEAEPIPIYVDATPLPLDDQRNNRPAVEAFVIDSSFHTKRGSGRS